MNENNKPTRTNDRRIFSHDTPPPILVTDGSLRIESDEALTRSTGGGRFQFKGIDNQDPNIAHIRIFQDNGEMIYEDLEALGSSVEIFIKNDSDQQVGNVIIGKGPGTAAGSFAFQIDSDRDMGTSTAGGRRRFKFDHPGGGGRFRLDSVEVTNARRAKIRFAAPPTGTGAAFEPSDYRVMIWRIPDSLID